MGYLGRVFPIFFLILGLNDRFALSFFEYSKTLEDGKDKMSTIFQNYKGMFAQCQDAKNASHERWFQRICPAILSTCEHWSAIQQIATILKEDLLCLQIREEYNDKLDRGEVSENETLEQIWSYWAMQITAANYALLFADGYLQNKDGNKDIAKNCAYLVGFFGVFISGNSSARIFSERAQKLVEKEFENSNPAEVKTATVLSNLYDAVVRDIHYTFLDSCDPINGQLNVKEIMKEEDRIKLTILNLYLADKLFESCEGESDKIKDLIQQYGLYEVVKGTNIDFFKNRDCQFKKEIVTKEELWRSAETLKNLIQIPSSGSKMVEILEKIENMMMERV